MTTRVDLRLLLDGHPIPLCPEAATMVLTVADHQEIIRKQGAGQVLITYNGTDQTISLLKLTFRAKARPLT